METTPKTPMDLAERRLTCLSLSEAAVLKHPGGFAEIRRLLDCALFQPLFLDDYYDLAKRLADALVSMGPGTLFSNYFPENLDPDQKGRAQHFRHVCMDLKNQIEELETWKKARRRLKALGG